MVPSRRVQPSPDTPIIMMRGGLTLAALLSTAHAWDSCSTPNFEWLGMDIGSGRGAGNAFAFSNSHVFVGGYSQGAGRCSFECDEGKDPRARARVERMRSVLADAQAQ